jgi:hypothetical protein
MPCIDLDGLKRSLSSEGWTSWQSAVRDRLEFAVVNLSGGVSADRNLDFNPDAR